MDRPAVPSRIAPGGGDIRPGMRYNYFGNVQSTMTMRKAWSSAARGEVNETFGSAWNLSTHNDPVRRRKVAYDQLAGNIARWNKTGLKGYVAFGSNGEYVYLSDEEKLEVVKTVAASAAPGMKVIAGTGCESTWQTIQLTNACARLGAHAALVVTPFYYGGA